MSAISADFRRSEVGATLMSLYVRPNTSSNPDKNVTAILTNINTGASEEVHLASVLTNARRLDPGVPLYCFLYSPEISPMAVARTMKSIFPTMKILGDHQHAIFPRSLLCHSAGDFAQRVLQSFPLDYHALGNIKQYEDCITLFDNSTDDVVIIANVEAGEELISVAIASRSYVPQRISFPLNQPNSLEVLLSMHECPQRILLMPLWKYGPAREHYFGTIEHVGSAQHSISK